MEVQTAEVVKELKEYDKIRRVIVEHGYDIVVAKLNPIQKNTESREKLPSIRVSAEHTDISLNVIDIKGNSLNVTYVSAIISSTDADEVTTRILIKTDEGNSFWWDFPATDYQKKRYLTLNASLIILQILPLVTDLYGECLKEYYYRLKETNTRLLDILRESAPEFVSRVLSQANERKE